MYHMTSPLSLESYEVETLRLNRNLKDVLGFIYSVDLVDLLRCRYLKRRGMQTAYNTFPSHKCILWHPKKMVVTPLNLVVEGIFPFLHYAFFTSTTGGAATAGALKPAWSECFL